jgi:hypothetical protein
MSLPIGPKVWIITAMCEHGTFLTRNGHLEFAAISTNRDLPEDGEINLTTERLRVKLMQFIGEAMGPEFANCITNDPTLEQAFVVDPEHHLAYLKLPKYTHDEGACPKFKKDTTLRPSPKVKGSSKAARKLARAAIEHGPSKNIKLLLPPVVPKAVTGKRSRAPRVVTPPKMGTRRSQRTRKAKSS